MYDQHGNVPAHSEKSQSWMLRNHLLSQIFRISGIDHLFWLHLSFNFTICLIFIFEFIFILIAFHIPLCIVRQPYKGCPFTCNLVEITWNETVWHMPTNNVKESIMPKNGPTTGVTRDMSSFHVYVSFKQNSGERFMATWPFCF